MKRYVKVVMLELDDDGNIKADGFKRYGIVDRSRNKNNRVIFSTRTEENNNVKYLAMQHLGTDNFNREEFEKKMAEKQAQRFSERKISVSEGS